MLVLSTLSGKFEPNLVFLPQRVFDIRPLKLLVAFEIEAIFCLTVIHISKILFETNLWDIFFIVVDYFVYYLN